ncbi:sulfurtransferase [Arthrobacter sp. TPD3018]|uniref:chromate resistance protein ChrB domain-containing protein n=1 Tax=Bacteria TaxID=2 RepID=UPI000D50AA66|nr:MULTISPECIES: sulfurtransferase/chromate resistance protein [Bacteria]PVE52666.1 sulfurtransferase [Sphingomonas sp. TPD3009]PVE52849.1 sulfurtransferase [Arthrobacter sp. TPD3018]PVE81238.1 sulfurtransferase [Sphingomonas melonis]
MPAPNAIPPEKLSRLVGTAGCPRIIDLRLSPIRTIPSAVPGHLQIAPPVNAVIVVDQDGGTGSVAAAAMMRSNGKNAEVLEGGYAAWARAGLPTVELTHVPPRRPDGRTWWVTRARPKVDRIACPWLIRRFVDPAARFLFVAPGEVLAVAAHEQAEPFDVVDDGVFWSHRGDLCTFDVMVEAFGLADHAPLTRLAAIVRGADTDRLDLAPEAAGLLAISLGLSRSHSDDHQQLEAGIAIYDALYRWARDAQAEHHDWSSHQPSRMRVTA